MATYRENLVARMEAIGAELAAMTANSMGGHANVNHEDGGTTIDHVGYRKSLLDELETLRGLLAAASEVEASAADDDGPFEIETRCTP